MGKQTVIVIEIDGVNYSLDVADLTAREVGVLKQVAHLKGLNDLPEALEAGDLEAVVALAVIAMRRAGINVDYERLLDMPIGKIKIILPEGDETPFEEQASSEETGTLS